MEGAELDPTDTVEDEALPKTESENDTDTGAEDTDSEAAQDTAGEGADETEEGDPAEDAADDPAAAEDEKPKGRRSASDTIRALKAERKAERAERDRLIAERATLAAQLEHHRQQAEHSQTAAQRQAEEDRLSLLDPSEKELYLTKQRMQALEHRLNQAEARRQDDLDRTAFHAKAAHDEVYAKYADEIEQVYQDGLRKGVAAPREDLLAWKLGKELLKNKAQKVADKKTQTGKRIAAVTGSAKSAKSDVAATRKGKTAEERLSGVAL